MRGRLFGASAAALLLLGVPVIAATQLSPDSFAAVVASADRPASDKARDAERKPAEMLAFAEIRPGQKVIELVPGKGYFTRLLSLAVGPGGHVYAVSANLSPELDAWAQAHGNLSMQTAATGQWKAPEPVDVVWTTQNYHDFKNAGAGDRDGAALTNAAAFAALKPGGVYLVSDHQGAPGSDATQTATLHRIEDAAVIREVEAAGFKLDARSDILRHPADDHTLKVFDPAVRGKTDQFVLRFRKPAAKR